MSATAIPSATWTPQEGAPIGHPFDLEVPSASRARRAYRVTRDEAGVIRHAPPCEAWTYGRRPCRHVKRALDLADRPEQTYLEDVIAAWHAGGWHPKGRDEYACGVFRGALAARARRQEIEAFEAPCRHEDFHEVHRDRWGAVNECDNCGAQDRPRDECEGGE